MKRPEIFPHRHTSTVRQILYIKNPGNPNLFHEISIQQTNKNSGFHRLVGWSSTGSLYQRNLPTHRIHQATTSPPKSCLRTPGTKVRTCAGLGWARTAGKQLGEKTATVGAVASSMRKMESMRKTEEAQDECHYPPQWSWERWEISPELHRRTRSMTWRNWEHSLKVNINATLSWFRILQHVQGPSAPERCVQSQEAIPRRWVMAQSPGQNPTEGSWNSRLLSDNPEAWKLWRRSAWRSGPKPLLQCVQTCSGM